MVEMTVVHDQTAGGIGKVVRCLVLDQDCHVEIGHASGVVDFPCPDVGSTACRGQRDGRREGDRIVEVWSAEGTAYRDDCVTG